MNPTVMSDSAVYAPAEFDEQVDRVVLARGLTLEVALSLPGAKKPEPKPEVALSLPGAKKPEPKPEVLVDAQWLIDRDACEDGLGWFVKTYGRQKKVPAAKLLAGLRTANPSWTCWLRAKLKK